jgi:cysteine desulfurase
MRRVYLDYAATTPVHPEVAEVMSEYHTTKFANPSSLHVAGREAREAVSHARAVVARALGALPEEIIFTSGGTEADNFAIKGIAHALGHKGNHIVTSSVEHHAVLEPCRFLSSKGYRITELPVDKYGSVNPDDVKKALTDKTILVSIMHANNEVGTIEPIETISEVCREKGVYFHTDAVQSFGLLDTNVDDLGVDLLSISGHKFYGPKGVGALYIRTGTRIVPLLHGGAQEMHKRASTHNVPGIAGLGKAAELVMKERKERRQHCIRLRDMLSQSILETIGDVRLNGHPEKRLPNNCHIIVKHIEGESMLLKLDAVGIEVSTGSACSSDSIKPSHVMLAMGISPMDAHGSLRMTIGSNTTVEDIQYVLEHLPVIVRELRKISPMAAM